MSDRVEESLRRAEEMARDAVPARMLVAARALSGTLRAQRRARVQRLAAAGAAVTGMLIGTAFTPPGRAATGWLAELAGIGEEPSLQQVGAIPGSAVVVSTGELADGTRYEVIAKRVNYESFFGPDRRARPSGGSASGPFVGHGMLCFQVDFPDVLNRGQGGHCSDGEEMGRGLGVESVSLHQKPDSSGDVADPDSPGVFLGIVETPPTAEVRVFQIDSSARRDRIPADLVAVDDELLERTGYERPVSIFVSPLDSAVIAAGNRGEAEVRAIAYDHRAQEIGDAEVFFQSAECRAIAEAASDARGEGALPVAPADPNAREGAVWHNCLRTGSAQGPHR